jgi:hypothetical protein
MPTDSTRNFAAEKGLGLHLYGAVLVKLFLFKLVLSRMARAQSGDAPVATGNAFDRNP